MPSRASSSARSFSGWPAWPLTQCHSTSCLVRSSSRRCQSSAFLTGLRSAVRQPFRFQPWIHLRDAVLHVGAIGVKVDVARPLEGVERLDGGDEFHLVVGRDLLRRRTAPCGAARHQNRAPAAGAGISGAGAVGIDRDMGLVAVWRRGGHAVSIHCVRKSLLRCVAGSGGVVAVFGDRGNALVKTQPAQIDQRIVRFDDGAGRRVEPVISSGSAGNAARRRGPASARRRIRPRSTAGPRCSRAAAPAPW